MKRGKMNALEPRGGRTGCTARRAECATGLTNALATCHTTRPPNDHDMEDTHE